MTTATLTLTAFLLARIADDEAAAQAATPGPWWAEGVWYHSGGFPEENAQIPWPTVGHGRTGADVVAHTARQDGADAAHIATHDPARVLAQCEALRAAVALHGDGHDCPALGYIAEGEIDGRWHLEGEPCPTLRALAAIWSSHPDFDPSWSAA